MSRTPLRAPLLPVLMLSAMLAACGQRGPLYLPDEPAPEPQTAPANGRPAETDVDADENADSDAEDSDDTEAADKVFTDDFDDGDGR